MEPIVDPVSGNPVPPGSAPEEVRDDVDAKLSTGEYVLPADVVRYLGVEKIEHLVKKAKEGMESLLKGQDAEQGEDDLPFGAEELQAVDEPEEPLQMAKGGLVNIFGDEDDSLYKPIVPSGDDSYDATPTGLAGSVDSWSFDDFDKYSNNRGNIGSKVIEAGISSLPFGGKALEYRQSYLDKNVPSKIEEMMKTGKDLQGNLLTQAQIDRLQGMKTSSVAPTKDLRQQVVDPVVEALGLSGLVNGVQSHVQGVRDQINSAKTSVKDSVKDALGMGSSKKDSGLISRPDEVTKSEKTSSNTDKSSKSESKSESKSNETSSDKSSGSKSKDEEDDKDKK